MPRVQDILAHKGDRVHTIGPQASVLDAAVLMNQEKIGCLVVLDGNHVVGMFSERDILRRVVAACLDPAATAVGDIMTDEVVCCRLHTKLLEARGVMKNRRIRHMPVLNDDESLCGIISIGDLNAHDMHEQESTIYIMEQYIYGRT
jgi:CBS domain-containing protein